MTDVPFCCDEILADGMLGGGVVVLPTDGIYFAVARGHSDRNERDFIVFPEEMVAINGAMSTNKLPFTGYTDFGTSEFTWDVGDPTKVFLAPDIQNALVRVRWSVCVEGTGGSNDGGFVFVKMSNATDIIPGVQHVSMLGTTVWASVYGEHEVQMGQNDYVELCFNSDIVPGATPIYVTDTYSPSSYLSLSVIDGGRTAGFTLELRDSDGASIDVIDSTTSFGDQTMAGVFNASAGDQVAVTQTTDAGGPWAMQSLHVFRVRDNIEWSHCSGGGPM